MQVTPQTPQFSCFDQLNSQFNSAIIWLRGDGEFDSLARGARKVLAFALTILLTVTVIGIPVVLAGLYQWCVLPNEFRWLDSTYVQDLSPKSSSSNRSVIEESHAEISNKKIKSVPKYTEKEVAEIMERHDKACKEKGFPTPLLRPGNFNSDKDIWPTLEGISFLADELCEKKEVENLFVCQNLQVFKQRLIDIEKSDHDVREVLIVPNYNSHWTCDTKDVTKCTNEEHKTHDYHSQHRLPVFIEKKGNKINICVMESGGTPNLDHKNTTLDEKNQFNCDEHIHAHIRAANLKNATYYYAAFKRHFSSWGGCDTFALNDGISFLRMPSFFDEIEAKGQLGIVKGVDKSIKPGSIDNPLYITNLPPSFMRLTQSLSKIEKYLGMNTGLKEGYRYDLSQKIGRKKQTLREKVKHNTKQVVDKKQNQCIDKKIAASRNRILEALETKSTEFIQTKINRRLLK